MKPFSSALSFLHSFLTSLSFPKKNCVYFVFYLQIPAISNPRCRRSSARYESHLNGGMPYHFDTSSRTHQQNRWWSSFSSLGSFPPVNLYRRTLPFPSEICELTVGSPRMVRQTAGRSDSATPRLAYSIASGAYPPLSTFRPCANRSLVNLPRLLGRKHTRQVFVLVKERIALR